MVFDCFVTMNSILPRPCANGFSIVICPALEQSKQISIMYWRAPSASIWKSLVLFWECVRYPLLIVKTSSFSKYNLTLSSSQNSAGVSSYRYTDLQNFGNSSGQAWSLRACWNTARIPTYTPTIRIPQRWFVLDYNFISNKAAPSVFWLRFALVRKALRAFVPHKFCSNLAVFKDRSFEITSRI